jgi:hypothetical protein
MRNYKSIRLLAAIAAVLLAGCGNPSTNDADDPTLGQDKQASYANSRIFVTKDGEPFELEGCRVQLHAVRVTRPGTMPNAMVTLATAKCPTANVTATHESCGKNCEHDTLRIEATAVARTQRDDAARQLAKQKTELKAKMSRLDDEKALTAAQLEELEQTLPN